MRAEATLSDGTRVSGQAKFVEGMVEHERTFQAEEDRWVADLRADGVKAAHPDDGWVDRKRDRVHLSYPQFNDGVEVGDVLALGSPWRSTRLVRVVAFEANPFALAADRDRWYLCFEPT